MVNSAPSTFTIEPSAEQFAAAVVVSSSVAQGQSESAPPAGSSTVPCEKTVSSVEFPHIFVPSLA
eukprot:COSAG06_NODE_5751_length_3293_cov_2.735128_1_plen_65_part_00